MGILGKLDALLGGERRTFNYLCTNCELEFESPHADMSRVSCPDCGSTRTRGVAA